MIKEKQIKEMARLIYDADINFLKCRLKTIDCDLIEPPLSRTEYIATELYNAGYHKPTYVSSEMLEELQNESYGGH